jgi:hypothetical protein
MKTRDALKDLTRVDIAHIVELRQGANALRDLLGVGGLYGRAVCALDERCAAAARQGLRDGWLELDSQGDLYAGEERAWYLAALEVSASVLVCQERAA